MCVQKLPFRKIYSDDTRKKRVQSESKWKTEKERGKNGRNAIPVSSFYKRVCPDWVYSYVLWEKGLMNTGAYPVHAEVLFSSSLSCPRGRHNFRFITLHSCWSQCSLVINVLDSIRRWCFCFWLAISWGRWLTSRNLPFLSGWHIPNGDSRPCRLSVSFLTALLRFPLLRAEVCITSAHLCRAVCMALCLNP